MKKKSIEINGNNKQIRSQTNGDENFDGNTVAWIYELNMLVIMKSVRI